MVSCASDHDLPVARQIMEDYRPFRCGTLYADKAYIDEYWEIVLNRDFSVRIITPRKLKKNDFLRGGDAFSSFVSALRQQIESFFNWLNELTNIQSASKVRSSDGLLVHIFGRIAAAFFARYLYS